MATIDKVKVWQEDLIIPTYKAYNPEKNPLFIEKRAYQGSTGKVYPLPVTEKIYDEKSEKEYNEFITNAKKESLYEINKTASYGDELITLSTCSYHVKDGRFAVIGKKIEN